MPGGTEADGPYSPITKVAQLTRKPLGGGLIRRFFARHAARHAAAFGVVMLSAMAPLQAGAADFPTRPITVVVPYTAGGAPDVFARTLTEAVGKALGQPIIIDNRTGAGGNIGAQYVQRANPDGYTLLLCAFGCAVAPALYNPAPYDIVKDFAPVTLLGTVPSVLVVNPNVPAKNLAELIAYAQANPGKLNAGSAGVGTSPHLAIELLRAKTGAQVAHIPYKGVASVAQDLLAGQIDMLFDNLPSSLANIRAGKLRALAVASERRSPSIPDVPTFAEAGVPGFYVTPWFGLMAPAKTPPAILDKLNAAFVQALADPEVKARTMQQGIDLTPSTRAGMAAFVVNERDKWSQIIKANGIRAD
ncbi:ABC transporter substrate-binding protein [Bordetella genomosp. 9]|uniref:ABC transporter substrate-binding protein n=2 Tax=Bordetella genomosp. 9 TaxID=1416803 RepID=A0A261R766_9BORD|nr:ABC transporter substrate-binding protein [Bordetella genomosp. 9]